jgi:phosphoribosylamine---glycine ligase
MSVLMPTRVLVVGGGGREHALAWKLSSEPGVNEVTVAPGSAGIAQEPRVSVAPVQTDDTEGIVRLARSHAVELVVVGPEAPLAAGLADRLAAEGIAVFGPSRAAARLEASKAFCHEIADAAGVPMAEARVCATRDEAAAAIARFGERGFVVKEDGLAGGKGVTVFDASHDAIHDADALLDRLYAVEPRTTVIEERLAGREASVITICDGRRALALPAARDHKRLSDGDHGPNTGGMGAYSPLIDLDDQAVDEIVRSVHEPLLAELVRRGTPFRGFLYAGLMLTAAGPRLLETNVRLGDPEAQVILPRVAVALGPLLRAAARGELPAGVRRIAALPGATVGIVLAAAAYPDEPSRGDVIEGLERAGHDALVFHMGTARGERGWETNGGRILTIVGSGRDVAAARAAAERGAARISWPGMQRRHDIGATLAEAVA